MKFADFIREASLKNRSRIILALDLSALPGNPLFEELEEKAKEVLNATAPYICAVKINMQLLLPLGLYSGVKRIIDETHSKGLPIIMDCKLSDVGHTNKWAAKHYFNAGFDAMIVNPLVGWSGGLESVFEVAEEYDGRGVILLVYTSHKAAPESYELEVKDPVDGRFKPLFEIFARRALEWNASGVIVGGTYPDKIRYIHSILEGKVPIYSPGIGVQGGVIDECLKAGSSFFIIGRSIYLSSNPGEAARRFRDLSWTINEAS